MSKHKKSKKARQPNIPLATGPAPGAGGESPAPRAEAPSVNFDYSHIQKDLARIFTLAGLFIAALVALSFILK